MKIFFHKTAAAADKAALRARLRELLPGARTLAVPGGLSVTGFKPAAAADAVPLLENSPGVREAGLALGEACPLVCSGRGRRPDFFKAFTLIAGPCAVESEASYLATAQALKAAGAHALRAAIFKPRSSPYAFQGLGWAAAPILRRAKKLTGLPLVTECTDPRQLDRLAGLCDMLQIGARNMRNYELLKEAGRSGLPVLLKRGMHATLKEWLLSAEYLLKHGARGLALCERGDGVTGPDGLPLDLKLLAAAKKATGLTVIADPSHAAGERSAAALLAVTAWKKGADGLLIEASLNPLSAKVDGSQTISVATFASLPCTKRN